MKQTETFQVIDVAMGRRPADHVIRHGQLVNVLTGEIEPDTDIAIAGSRIAAVGDCSYTIGPSTRVTDAHNAYLVPGLIDAHMHVESTMLTVRHLAEAILPLGTTAIFMDPHELANIYGLDGVRRIHAEGRGLPLKVFTTIPSCVPAARDLEDAASQITPDDVASGLTWPDVAGLSEVMNVPGVIHNDPALHEEIAVTLARGRKVTGHLPTGDPRVISAYAAAGIDSDHESTRREEALTKLRRGMYIMAREGSAWQDVRELAQLITRDHVDPRHIMLVTDDVDPLTLVHQGHLNHVVRRAIEEGIDPVTAIQMATLNAAEYFQMGKDLGSIAPGKIADILLIPDLTDMTPVRVFVDGDLVVSAERPGPIAFPDFAYPVNMTRSVHLPKPRFSGDDFRMTSQYKTAGETTRVRAIAVIENQAVTDLKTFSLTVGEGSALACDVGQDVIRLTCLERHGLAKSWSHGFVHGFGLKRGAVASTVAHDAHNLLVMGTSEEEMADAVNRLADMGGGLIAVLGGAVLAAVPLPVGGLLSTEPVGRVAEQLEALSRAWRALGCELHAPYMTLSLIALPVIPRARLSNRGLVDVPSGTLSSVEVEPEADLSRI